MLFVKDSGDRIPEEVRERAEKAGLKKVDWYAGRLETGDDPAREQRQAGSLEMEREELFRTARRMHTDQPRKTVVAFMRRLGVPEGIGRLLRPRTRS